MGCVLDLTLRRPASFEDSRAKQPDCMWLCTRVTRAPKVVESCSKAKKTRQVF